MIYLLTYHPHYNIQRNNGTVEQGQRLPCSCLGATWCYLYSRLDGGNMDIYGFFGLGHLLREVFENIKIKGIFGPQNQMIIFHIPNSS